MARPKWSRQAKPAAPLVNLCKTLTQAALFWTFFLAVLPYGVCWLETAAGLQHARFQPLRVVGTAILLCASALGLWSAFVMALTGKGTPLPMDSARELVIAGPYAYVRNPMAVAGLVQGMAVGLIVGSWAVLLYVAIGIFLWNCVVRPHEEADLLNRFGADYRHYRQNVCCWIPRLTRYR